MSVPEIRLGIIGLGWPGAQHTLGAAESPCVRVAAACDLNPDRRDEYRRRFPDVPRLLGDHGELLADADVDAVVVCLPNFLHFPVTLAALRAGKHVLCEKPPTLDLTEMETVRATARTHGRTYAFGRQFRFDPAMLAAREAVAAGRLGNVYYAKTHWVRQRGIPCFGVGGWFTDQARAGGGALMDLGVHALDAAWYLAGCPRPVSASAHVGAHFAGTVPAGAKFDVDDTAVAFLRFAGGLCLHLEVAWAMNLAADDAATRPVDWCGRESMNTTLHGDAGTLQVDPARLFQVNSQDSKSLREMLLRPSDEPPPPASAASSFGRQTADFCRAVRTGTGPTSDADQAVELMRMLGALYESGRTGREVRLD